MSHWLADLPFFHICPDNVDIQDTAKRTFTIYEVEQWLAEEERGWKQRVGGGRGRRRGAERKKKAEKKQDLLSQHFFDAVLWQ